jgi:uncharacterized protein (UPF0303 family)
MPAPQTVEGLIAEEADLALARFDYETAWELGSAMRRMAAEANLPVAIEITHHGAVVFSTLLPGATPDNIVWTRRKRAVVEHFQHSSLYMRLLCEKNGVDFATRYRLSPGDYAASGGGVPIQVAGVGLVGVAAVSGLPDVDDHALVISALKQL